MIVKWKNFVYKSAFFGLALMMLPGCAGREVKEDLKPTYQFEIDEPLEYELSLSLDATVQAVVFNFDGNVNLTADLTFTPIETNEYGYKMQVAIFNPEVTAGNSQIYSVVIQALNFIRTYLSTIYVTPQGKVTVFYDGVPHPGLNSYGQILFPDFTDMDQLQATQENSTNFGMKYQEQRLMLTFETKSGVNITTDKVIKVGNELDIAVYDYDEYEDSVDPIEFGKLEGEYTDIFDYHSGQMTKKSGFLYLDGSMMLSQGIFTVTISLSGNGSFEITKKEEPAI